ncbi:anillin [Genypterus blacodes]|uniref:anillin n=1 Tax=Genypterus blacodes TaxID=154954 RepID=UPI003F75C7E7
MDPFTEKLLERTRARRENLQKKMAERPNANRQMVKRAREPLAETNSVISEPASDKVPQAAKPSPSKRKCSGENILPPSKDENQELTTTRPAVLTTPDPPKDKTVLTPVPPVSSVEMPAFQPAAHVRPEQKMSVQPEPERMVVMPPQTSGSTDAERTPHRGKEDLEDDPAPSAAGMKSRLQRLAEQRKCWDGTSAAAPDCSPLPSTKRQADAAPVAVLPASSGPPLGRRGRLANLAATIGSWEDDLSHAIIPKDTAQGKPGAASVPKFACRDANMAANVKPSAANHVVSSPAANKKPTPSSNQQVVYCPAKPSRVILPSPQKADIPETKPALQTVTSPQKNSCQRTVYPPSPQKTCPSSSSSAAVPQSPLKNQGFSRGLNLTSSPQKPDLAAKPANAGPSSLQQKVPAGAPVVKSFLGRFGERCQERANQSSPAGGATQARTPTVTPTVTPSATPNTRLVQERLRAAQAANTTTTDLIQKQKLERESELAQIRGRFQKENNMWKNKEEQKVEETNENPKNPKRKEQVAVECEAARHQSHDEPTAPSVERTETTTNSVPTGCALLASPPASTSSPLKSVTLTVEKPSEETTEEEEVREIEMNVDQSINSAVINGLFDGVLEQSDEEDEEEEEALNISSMSILAPLAETVAAVKSPERGRMMTSTPASSFNAKGNADNVPKPSKFQRAHMIRTASADSAEALDEDLKLPYSIDAYRSTRVKETERPHVKQVIVRKEDVSNRGEEQRGASNFSLKQKMKVLTNEVNLQQTVIHQASQALNCCTDEEHGKGSQVEAEAERLLLVATERREALKAELDRLKGGAAQQKKAPAELASASKGSITLQELRLPLKADFVCSTANKPDSTKHSFFVMLRAGAENTVATPLATTHNVIRGDTLTFTTKYTLSDVSSDFEIDVEVYGLVQKRDLLSDKKKKASKSKAMTPKRFLAITKSVQTPVVASPGGPNAVRTSHFALVGSHKLTLSSIGTNKFALEKVPFLCPLDGHIYLKMQCEVGSTKVEEKGFLTMFEDVSGFGAWHRRWCVLSGYCISYWTYPDDEKRKNPIGRLNLANCTSNRVEPANREFCARPNTFELITVRPQKEDDKETLVSQCMNTMCVTKNWLSADTKDERNLWMRKLNQILVDLRMWQPDSCYRPL